MLTREIRRQLYCQGVRMSGHKVGGSGGWVVASVVLVVLVAAGVTSAVDDEAVQDSVNSTSFTFDDQLKQVVWKKCALQLTPTCLKLTLVRLVDRLSQDTLYQPLPGVTLSSNRSRITLEPPAASSRGDLSIAERLDEYLRHRVNSYARSLTLTVKPFDLSLFNTTGIFDTVVDTVTGRKKDGVGLGAVAMMMGGAMMTMMMSALAALAGKAMMTSMMALMLAAMSAMKGGGGGGGKTTTYEVIAQPHHSDHHGWKRSVDVSPLQGMAHWTTAS